MELKNKVAAFLGDSITEGHSVEDVENNRYDNVIKTKCGLKEVYNYGIGGTRIAHQTKVSKEKPRWDLSFCGRAYNITKDAEVIFVFGGTNDYGHGDAPFGTLNDKEPDTFCGSVDFLMNLLKEEFPESEIIFMTPARRKGCTNVSIRPEKLPDAKVLKAYVDVIIEKGKQNNIPVLNMYDELGIDPNIEEDFEKYTSDGLHFNDLGHSKIADCVIEFVKNL